MTDALLCTLLAALDRDDRNTQQCEKIDRDTEHYELARDRLVLDIRSGNNEKIYSRSPPGRQVAALTRRRNATESERGWAQRDPCEGNVLGGDTGRVYARTDGTFSIACSVLGQTYTNPHSTRALRRLGAPIPVREGYAGYALNTQHARENALRRAGRTHSGGALARTDGGHCGEAYRSRESITPLARKAQTPLPRL